MWTDQSAPLFTPTEEGKATARGLTPEYDSRQISDYGERFLSWIHVQARPSYQTNVLPERAKSSTKLIAILAIAGGAAAAGVVAASGGGGSPRVLRFLRAALQPPLPQERPFSVLRNNEVHKEAIPMSSSSQTVQVVCRLISMSCCGHFGQRATLLLSSPAFPQALRPPGDRSLRSP